jgi:hypothetical protein
LRSLVGAGLVPALITTPISLAPMLHPHAANSFKSII